MSGSRRTTLFDYLERVKRESGQNKYCLRGDLSNEASVEQFFVSRLLQDLGYADKEIKPKKSLKEIVVARGSKKELFKPDYAIVCLKKPRWIIDAKAPDEEVDKWTYQGAGYALGLNQEYKNENPCAFYAITNGMTFKVFKWDESAPVLSLNFAEFEDDSPAFFALRSLLGAKVIRSRRSSGKPPRADEVLFQKPSIEEVRRIFNNCHNLIRRSQKMPPQPAFFEFAKLMFLKLLEDRKLHEDSTVGPLLKAGKPIDRSRVVFSTKWIHSLQDSGVENPVDDVLFKKLTGDLKEAIRRGEKKPIFEEGDHIELQVGTIEQVVTRLESYDMFGIDEDLNGRMFETFLSGTMRGRELGQFFTPRSIVKLAARLANPVATRNRMDCVLDAFCGTGGFLIEAFTVMRNQIRQNTSLSGSEEEELQKQLANNSIFGIDAGTKPPVARIARINMYLHGDGGSRIYAADSLDKSVKTGVGMDPQSKAELEELRALMNGIKTGGRRGFDIGLTNPPFSMGYSENLPAEKEILGQYVLPTWGREGTTSRRPSLTSGIMSIERYADLLKPGGVLITVIDDSILGGGKFDFTRDFIRCKFVIRAVISLPGDAFQRVGARVKTSLLFLQKREGDGQPDVFMYECQHVGLDDVPTKTRPSKALEAKQNAEREVEAVCKAFKDFLDGKRGSWLVPSIAITDRLDVKSCLPRQGDVVRTWKQRGYTVVPLHQVVDCIEDETLNPKDSPDTVLTLLKVLYDGIAMEGDKAYGRELTYSRVQHPKKDDLVVSNIAAVYGSFGVIPGDLEHVIISSEFTIMRLKNNVDFDPWFLWGFLRSPEVKARLLTQSTGMNRHRVGWDMLKDIPVPKVDGNIQRQIGRQLQESVSGLRRATQERATATETLNTLLDLENSWAVQRLRAAKPPK